MLTPVLELTKLTTHHTECAVAERKGRLETPAASRSERTSASTSFTSEGNLEGSTRKANISWRAAVVLFHLSIVLTCAVWQKKAKKAGPKSVFNSVIQKLEQQYMVSPFIVSVSCCPLPQWTRTICHNLCDTYL